MKLKPCEKRLVRAAIHEASVCARLLRETPSHENRLLIRCMMTGAISATKAIVRRIQIGRQIQAEWKQRRSS